jgi:S-adenosylmethionine hydrolase
MAGRIITLTTDFGDSHYVGEMKGRILLENPDATIVDITHSIEAQNIPSAAFVLSRIWRSFPDNSIHVVVVDPGVGSGRLALAVATSGCILVGPDNGVLRWALKDLEVERVVGIDEKLFHDVSATFHGRDVFAPAAAKLSKGADIDMLGKRVDEMKPLDIEADSVLHVDGFGNIITSVAGQIRPGEQVTVLHGGKSHEARAVRTFTDAKEGELIVLVGSHGLVEVDISLGDAAKKLKAKAGDRIQVI